MGHKSIISMLLFTSLIKTKCTKLTECRCVEEPFCLSHLDSYQDINKTCNSNLVLCCNYLDSKITQNKTNMSKREIKELKPENDVNISIVYPENKITNFIRAPKLKSINNQNDQLVIIYPVVHNTSDMKNAEKLLKNFINKNETIFADHTSNRNIKVILNESSLVKTDRINVNYTNIQFTKLIGKKNMNPTIKPITIIKVRNSTRKPFNIMKPKNEIPKHRKNIVEDIQKKLAQSKSRRFGV